MGNLKALELKQFHVFYQGKYQDSKENENVMVIPGILNRFGRYALGAIYKGKDEILLSKLILEPQHSILTQSYDCRLRLDHRRPHNGDGFGIGYYTRRELGPEPCIFTSTTPAWNCQNLSRLASKTASTLIFAHVRASTEGAHSESNCHPFARGPLMWMHNGNIANWNFLKRRLATDIDNRWFIGVQGNTDSEWAFALFLDCLHKSGHDPDDKKYAETGFGHTVLREAMLQTISRINAYALDAVQHAEIDTAGLALLDGTTTATKPATDSRHTTAMGSVYQSETQTADVRSLLNFAISDGQSVVCTRYVSSKTDEAASLYFSSGTKWAPTGIPGHYRMERHDKGADIVLVASEPLTFERDNWVIVPTNSVITIHKQTVMIHPILDQFHNEIASFERSSGYAVSKGLVSHGPGGTESPIDPSVGPSGAVFPTISVTS